MRDAVGEDVAVVGAVEVNMEEAREEAAAPSVV